MREKGSVIHATRGVTQVITGGKTGASVLTIPCEILVPAALEHAIDSKNAYKIRAEIVACGSNGPNTARAERILHERGITVIYDFLANSGGVTASYFEWLRNLHDRFQFEAVEIRHTRFRTDTLSDYIMPEFAVRIQEILSQSEDETTTARWNGLMRDMIYGALNDDTRVSAERGISLKTAGFIDSQLRVLAAVLARMSPDTRQTLWEDLPNTVKELLRDYLQHPEVELIGPGTSALADV